jgi:cobalt-precorrin 5A hydrolase
MERGAMIAAGFGFRPGAGAAALNAAFEAALATAGTTRDSVAIVATLDSRAEALRAMIAQPVVALPVAALAGVATPTQSTRIRAAFGTGSIAEAAALAALGPGARLLAPRHVSPDAMATCALAHRTDP